MKLSFKFLIAAVLFAAYNVTAGIWNKGVMDTYLRSCAVAKSVQELVWNTNHKKKDTNESRSEEDDDDEILDGFQPINGPISCAPILLFSKMVMNVYVDCGMHLIFHGVVAYICEVMGSFVSDHGLSPSFLSIVSERLSEFKELKLKWCKMKCLRKKLWLGENVLGFSRVRPFVFGFFS